MTFGEYFRDNKPDEHWGFVPEQRVHDIHILRGNVGAFSGDDRVNGDGALFVRFGDGAQTVALFLRFTTQSLHTDDVTGAA